MQDCLERLLRLQTENMLNGEPSMVKSITSGMPMLSESPKRLNSCSVQQIARQMERFGVSWIHASIRSPRDSEYR